MVLKGAVKTLTGAHTQVVTLRCFALLFNISRITAVKKKKTTFVQTIIIIA